MSNASTVAGKSKRTQLGKQITVVTALANSQAILNSLFNYTKLSTVEYNEFPREQSLRRLLLYAALLANTLLYLYPPLEAQNTPESALIYPKLPLASRISLGRRVKSWIEWLR